MKFEISDETSEAAYASLGIPMDELVRVSDELRSGYIRTAPRTRVVCVCGHSAGSHRTLGAEQVCQPTARPCHCRMVRGVIMADNLRPFKRISRGNGAAHALIQGMASLHSQGGKFEWIEGEQKCAKCLRVGVPVTPVQMSKDKIIINDVNRTTYDIYDYLLCKETCYPRFEMEGNAGWEV